MVKQASRKINTQGYEISILKQNQKDYISLTDIAKYKNRQEPYIVISHWLSNYATIDFLATWEELNNPKFNPTDFRRVRNERGRLSLTPKQWIGLVNASGLKSTAGRYGGTYAHSDIALEFASWVSPEFKLYIIKEYQSLKQNENYHNQIEWHVQRELAKINYTIQTDAIKTFLLPDGLTQNQIAFTYANEADLLNVALFGLTAKEFKSKFPDKTGNQRDNATIEQNIIMANLESSNALMIRQGIVQSERLKALRELAMEQLKSILSSRAAKHIKQLTNSREN